jgi:hypothetical protein
MTTSLLAASASERKFIREGMSEGGVRVKIGKPDGESDVSAGGATITEKNIGAIHL